MPTKDLLRDKTGYVSGLHCLQQELDWEAQRPMNPIPSTGNSSPVHSAIMATSMEICALDCQKILGLGDTYRASRVFVLPTWRSSHSIQNTGECKATSVLAGYWCRQTGLLKENARLCKEVTASQGAPTVTWHTRGTLVKVMDYFNLDGKQVIWIWNYVCKFPFLLLYKMSSWSF